MDERLAEAFRGDAFFGEQVFGWPVPILSVTWHFDQSEARVITDGLQIPIGRSNIVGVSSAVIPLRLKWPDAAFGTLFWAVVAGMVPFFRLTRRWNRYRRGLCPMCGYPRGSAGRCSECGCDVSARPTNQLPTSSALCNAIAKVKIHEAIEASPANHAARRFVVGARQVTAEARHGKQVVRDGSSLWSRRVLFRNLATE